MNSYFATHREPATVKPRILLTLAFSLLVAAMLSIAFRAAASPAYTLEDEPFCGMESHVHTDACYEKVLICGVEETPEPAGSDAAAGADPSASSVTANEGAGTDAGASASATLSASASETLGATPTPAAHTHTDACYETHSVLTCDLEESSGHAHSEACFERVLICADDTEGHVHEEDCFENRLTCELDESPGHTHGETCFQNETVLVCTLDEGVVEDAANGAPADGAGGGPASSAPTDAASASGAPSNAPEPKGHVHTDACYQLQLTCSLEEHEHSLACYSNPSADVESPSDWEATLPGSSDLSGIWADDLLLVAKSQLGYTESDANYRVIGDEKKQGYTRYGAWFGTEYGIDSAYDDWCAMFVAFCLHHAGIPAEAMPRHANCQHWIEALSNTLASEDGAGENGEDTPTDPFIPTPGDLVFFDWNADEVADHMGIVSEVVANADGTTSLIRTIEGNSSDSVRECEYAPTDPAIMGYAALPANPDIVTLRASSQIKTTEPTGGLPGESNADAEPDAGTDADTPATPQYVLEDGAYYYAAKESDLPRYYQWSSYGIAYDVHSFVLIPSSELQDGEWTPNTSNWSGKAGANYVVAYCADDRTTASPTDSDLYSRYTIDNSRFTNSVQQRKIAAIIGNSYPFLTAGEARSAMMDAGVAGAESLDEHELTTAAQWAIWATIETVSHLEASDLCYVDIEGEGCNESNTVNPLAPSPGLSQASKDRIIAAKEWLCSLIEPEELQVINYIPTVTPNADGTSDLSVTITLNRTVEPDENAVFSMSAGSRSTETVQLSSGLDAFSVSLENLTHAELADARVNLVVSGYHMQAYFFDSNHWQDMLSGTWEHYSNDLSFQLGLETIDIAVTKVWTEQNTAVESVSVQLLANGAPFGSPVVLSDENNWHHVWENLNRYSVTEANKEEAQRTAIEYTVMELPVAGYYSSNITVESYEGVEKVLQWQEVDTFDGAGRYTLVSDTGALRAEYEENPPANWYGTHHFLSLAPVDLASAALTAKAVMWDVEEFGAGYSLNSVAYPDMYIGYSEVSVNPCAFNFADGKLQRGTSTYYFGGFYSNAAQVYTENAGKAMRFKLYKLVELELPSAETNFVITNTAVSATALSDISVTKRWQGRADGVYPSSVQVQLMQSDVSDGFMKRYGYPVTLNSENNWTYVWEDLPVILFSGSEEHAIEYTVVEVETPAGYTASLTYNAETAYGAENEGTENASARHFELVNTWQETARNVTIKKVDALNDETLLPGAQFDVYLTTNNIGDPVPYTSDVFGVKVGSFTTGEDGTASFPFGVGETYYLVETEAPWGYLLLEEAIGFTVVNIGESSNTGDAGEGEGENGSSAEGSEGEGEGESIVYDSTIDLVILSGEDWVEASPGVEPILSIDNLGGGMGFPRIGDDDGDEKDEKEELAQTGQTWWPVPILLIAGVVLIVLGRRAVK